MSERIGEILVEKLTEKEIKIELADLLFNKERQKSLDARDRELLTIVLREDKSGHLQDFIKEASEKKELKDGVGATTWKTIGTWCGIVDGTPKCITEPNVQFEIEFMDTSDEAVGKRTIDLLKEFNKRAVKEELLYARTAPLEEGTLKTWMEKGDN